MSLPTLLEEIRQERVYQDGRWGVVFDDKNTLNDWLTYMMIYGGQAARMDSAPSEQRKNLVKVAALAVAALESFDRNKRFAPRHYEDGVPVDTYQTDIFSS
jgi:hypothetical protein